MATKQNWIDLVRELLSGGDAPAEIRGKYHPRIVEKYLELAYDDIVTEVAKEGQITGDYSLLDMFALPYKVAVQYDSAREQKYIDLPILVMPLPDGAAIRLVSAPKNQGQQFIRIAMNSQSVWNELEADRVDPKPGFYIENEIMYFDENFPYGLTDVLLKIVASFGALGKNDRIGVPGGKNEMMFAKVFNIMMQKKANPQDYYDDNNNKQV